MSKRYKKKAVKPTWSDDLHFLNSGGYLDNEENVDHIYIELPYPMHNPFYYNQKDILKEIIDYKAKYAKLKNYAKKDVSASTILLNKRSTSALIPRNVLNLYKADDPDPFFDCDYNYYYTGGSLEYLNCGGVDYLIRPNINNELCVTSLDTCDNFKLKTKLDSPVYAIKALDFDSGLLLFTRQRNAINVLYTEDIASGKVDSRWSKESKNIPILDAKLNHVNKHNLALVNADFLLNIYNIETDKKIKTFDKGLCKNYIDNFSQLQFLDSNVLVYTNRSKIMILDTRTGKPQEELKTELEDCNSICSFKIHNNTVHVATRHDLCRYDVRNLSNLEYCSHMLNSPPCYIDICDSERDTFIVLSGQSVDQKVLFGCKSSNKIPQGIPSILDTYKETRLKKDLLLRGNLNTYLRYSITGVKIIEENNSNIIYSADCLGQLFKQRISNRFIDTYNAIDTLYDWLNHLPQPKKELHVTGIVELSDARFKLLHKNNNPDEIMYEQNNKCNEFLKKFEEIYNEENFSGMASDLMSIWDVGKSYTKGVGVEEVKSSRKVNDWIESSAFILDEDV